MYLFMKGSRVVLRGVRLRVCPLQFLVISAMRRLGNVQSLKHTCFAFELFAMNSQAGHPTLRRLHGKLSPRLTGLPYLADRATRLGGSPHLSCKRDQDKIRNYIDRRVTPPRRVTSPTWGSPPPCKQALTYFQRKKPYMHIKFYSKNQDKR